MTNKHLIKGLIMILFFGSSCSFMAKKKAQAKLSTTNRGVASLAPSGLRDQKNPKTKEDLLKMLKAGSAEVSHVVYFQDKKPLCYMLADSRLVPDFVKSSRYNKAGASKLTFKKGFPKCGPAQYDLTARVKNNFVLEGTQMAGFPLVMGTAFSALTGCFVGLGETIHNRIGLQSEKGGYIISGLSGVIFGGSGGLDSSINSTKSGPKTSSFAKIGSATAGGAVLGFSVGSLSYIACGKGIVYVLKNFSPRPFPDEEDYYSP